MWKNFGITLIDQGIQFLKKSFNANVDFQSYGFIRESLNKVGLEKVVDTAMDINYKFTDWSVWQEVLGMVNTILKKTPYIDDYWDCDNHAYFTSSFVPLVFGITCGEAFGKFTNSTSGQQWMHHWNLIIDKQGNVYVYDGMSGNSCQVIKGQPIKMGLGTYQVQTVKFY
jgi:hypothetical protein